MLSWMGERTSAPEDLFGLIVYKKENVYNNKVGCVYNNNNTDMMT